VFIFKKVFTKLKASAPGIKLKLIKDIVKRNEFLYLADIPKNKNL